MGIRDCNPKVWTPLGDGRKLGVEFELCHDDGYDIVAELTYGGPLEELLDEGYIPAVKEDDSVYGAELVSQPSDLETHKKRIPGLMQTLRDIGFFAGGSCGLHVHVERKSSADKRLTALLIQMVLATQSTPWDELLRTIHGRDVVNHPYCWAPVEYSREASQTIRDVFPNSLEAVETWPLEAHGDKFWRVNFRHKDTYEFRMGHGSMRIERILRRIEFALAAVTWVEELGAELLDTTPEQEVNLFKAWVQKKDFPVLGEFLHTLD